jgi:hypothetical protein
MFSNINDYEQSPGLSIYSIAAALAVPVDYFFPDQGSNHAASREWERSAPEKMTASDMREANKNLGVEVNTAGFATRAQPPTPSSTPTPVQRSS